MDCGSKGCRFKSCFLPLKIFDYFKLFNVFFYNMIEFKNSIIKNFILFNNYLIHFYRLNEYVWQEGLLIDFLQKKTLDNWLKKFVIYSANLFNERLVFDKIIKVYLNFFIWPLHKLFITEINNISFLLFINLFFFLIVLFFLFFFYIIFLF